MTNLSIIIPTYNAEKYIEKCIHSIYSDNIPKSVEVIVVDDGSTDQTAAIIKTLQKENSNLQLYSQPNKGVSSARNLGLRKANGKYILFVDSDDTLTSGWYKIIKPYILKQQSEFIIFHEHPQKINNLAISICSVNPIANLNTVWSKLYLHSIIKQRGILFKQNITNGEDLLFNLEYSFYIKTYQIIPQKLYLYHSTATSATKNINDQYISSDNAYQQNLKSLLKSYAPNLMYLSNISKINAWLAFFDHCSYATSYPKQHIKHFATPYRIETLSSYKQYKNFFSQYQLFLLRMLHKGHYKQVYIIIKLKHALKNIFH